MPPPKRASSPIGTPRKRSKKAATITEDDEEDSLESILAQIKAQEESETLAKQLHDEWNAPGPSSSRASRGPRAAPVARGHNDVAVDVIEISDDDDEPEDDEAMARRLAREWEADGVALIELSASTSQSEPRATRTQNNAESITSSDVPYISKLERYRDLFTGEKTCSCGANFASPRGHVVFSQQKSSQPSLLRLLHAPCKQCKTNHCRGCMTPVSCPLLCKGKDDHSDCPVETCCANVRIIAIFEALGGFDKIYLGERETSDQRAREAAAKARKHQVGSVGPGGTGYGMGDHGHFGLAYSHFKPRRGRTSGRGKATSVGTGEQSIRDALSSHFDEIVARALNAITGYLPAPYSDDPQIYDMLPHESIDALLFLSQLPDLLGNLLRNDSITDWIARIDVYHAMLALLRRMADCELTLEVLIGPRWEVSKSCGLEEWMWNDGNITWERDSDTDAPVSAPPLYAHFKKLTKQCETFLAGASSMLEHGVDEDGGEATETAVKATSLCGDIMAARDEIERAMTVMGKDPAAILHGPGLPSSTALSSGSGSGSGSASACTGNGKGKARDPGFDLERTYGRECERLAFQYATLSQPAENGSGLEYPGYNYAADVKRTANATRNPRDRLHLVKELAVMATSLPPGVWVRVDEIRNDAIKIMIAGPEGTPYAGGLFEFDCFIPLEYPNKPPLMHLRTTGGGSVRFNPNLYNSGKVCLSLLGTWPGRPEEQWSPKSTLLQVLVSIQSMILIELPYFNEPGYGKADPKNQRSIAYNKNICMQTTRWAIVDWLKDEHKDGVWAEVIASHFLTREVVIRKCIEDWAKTQPDIRKYRSYALRSHHHHHHHHHAEMLMMPAPMEWEPIPITLGNPPSFEPPPPPPLPAPPLEPPVLQASAGPGPQAQGAPAPGADVVAPPPGVGMVAPANEDDDWDKFDMYLDNLDDLSDADDVDLLNADHIPVELPMDFVYMLPQAPMLGGPLHAPMLGGPPHMPMLGVPPHMPMLGGPLYPPMLPLGGPPHMPMFGGPPHAHPLPHIAPAIAHQVNRSNTRNGSASNTPTVDLLEEFNKGIETVRKWSFSGDAEAD